VWLLQTMPIKPFGFSYSGSVSFTDAVQSVLLAVGTGVSGQGMRAFELYENVLKTDEIQNGYDMLLTGHSLGGALAAMVSRMSGAQAVTISGADGLALQKINDIVGEKPSSYRITNYMTSTENSGFSVKDLIQRMMLGAIMTAWIAVFWSRKSCRTRMWRSTAAIPLQAVQGAAKECQTLFVILTKVYHFHHYVD